MSEYQRSEWDNKVEGFTFYGKSCLMPVDRSANQQYFHWHIPIALSKLLHISQSDELFIYVNAERREFHIKVVEKEASK